jgi:antitoxin component YwqK of YwqJK toxin-antitoxin module
MHAKEEIAMDTKNLVVLCLAMLLIAPAPGFSEVVKEYWPDGQVKWERNYQDGKLDGMSREYGEDGTVLREESYKNDKKNGISKMYYKDGTLRMEANYQDGIKDGLETTYLRWDNKKTVTLFKQGKAINTKRYDEKERLRDEVIFTYGEEGSWVVRQILYDEKGKVILDQEL